jgi:transcription initiation factor TFIID subunit 6
MAPDLEYHIREIVQEASKFMRHSKRMVLTTADINNSLRMMGSEQLFGFSSKEPLRFQQVEGKPGLFVVDDPILDLDDIINQPLPACPLEPSISAHWMAIEGVQPAVPDKPRAPGEVPLQ